MAVKKKSWAKPTTIVEVGQCKYCNKMVTNDMSFLSFLDKTHAHFTCDRQHYYKQLINKQKERHGK